MLTRLYADEQKLSGGRSRDAQVELWVGLRQEELVDRRVRALVKRSTGHTHTH